LALELHPAHRAGDRKKLRKQRFRIEELEAEIEERQRILHFRANRHWETFLALIEILRHFGCLAGEEGLEPTEIGRTVAALRGDNELWLGLSLMSGHLDELEPADLAAVFEAISTEVNRPDLWSGFPPPPAAEEALHDLRGIRRELQRQQERASVVMPLWFEPELMGLVQAWAKGVSWNDLIANTSLDEGDVVRIMRRTVDLLAQVPYCEAISEQLRSNARAALKAINRFPVCEPIDLLAGGSGPNPATERAA
jgi:superfamily II RNA helicase